MAKQDNKPVSPALKDKNHIRTIKVGQSHYAAVKDDSFGRGRAIPWIQMKGHWLQLAGFQIDSIVKIRVMQGCLVLTTKMLDPNDLQQQFEKLGKQEQGIITQTIASLSNRKSA